MSRIGKQPVNIPSGVEIKIDSDKIEIKGPKGSLVLLVPQTIVVEKKDQDLVVSVVHKTKDSGKLWGTIRALLANMVKGVTEGFEKKLEIEGVGFRATQKGKDIEFALGFSHPILVPAPAGIELKVEKSTITISGISKELVGQTAATIRALKKPEPYKGKGIRYVGEVVRRKAGKKATATA